MRRFVFTCGDINGIGPEIVIKTINRAIKDDVKLIFLCPGNVFENEAGRLIPQFKYRFIKSGKEINNDNSIVDIIDLGRAKQELGKPTKVSGKISFTAIRKSFEIVSKGEADAVITAPISKYALSLAGISFPGHTEMYAEWSGVKDYVMMFLSSKMNCALLTIHEPLKKVPGLITKKLIQNKVGVILSTMKQDLCIKKPRLALLSLNPHAGENGRIGLEEERIIKPAIEKMSYDGAVSGPFVPDAFFANKLYKKFDVVVGMYHDQVLIPFKLLNFSSGVNYTAGLPIIRTSPDHGTAFDIAGKAIADESSIMEAFQAAEKIVNNRMKWNHKS